MFSKRNIRRFCPSDAFRFGFVLKFHFATENTEFTEKIVEIKTISVRSVFSVAKFLL